MCRPLEHDAQGVCTFILVIHWCGGGWLLKWRRWKIFGRLPLPPHRNTHRNCFFLRTNWSQRSPRIAEGTFDVIRMILLILIHRLRGVVHGSHRWLDFEFNSTVCLLCVWKDIENSALHLRPGEGHVIWIFVCHQVQELSCPSGLSFQVLCCPSTSGVAYSCYIQNVGIWRSDIFVYEDKTLKEDLLVIWGSMRLAY